jgi:hypothetical protein
MNALPGNRLGAGIQVQQSALGPLMALDPIANTSLTGLPVSSDAGHECTLESLILAQDERWRRA